MSDAQRHAEEQAAAWNGSSGEAWVASQQMLDGLFGAVEALLADAAAAAGARSVLDVGCGTGATTLAVARRLGADATCVGIDLSAPMVAVARERAARATVAPEFVCADAQTHAFAPATFDLVLSRFGVMFFPDPVAAFANLRRAAAPGAGARLVVWRGAADNPFMTTAARAAAPVLPDGAVPPAPAPDAPGQFAFSDPDRVRSILADSGWRGVDLEALDIPCAMAAADLAPYVTRLGPLARVLGEVDADTRARVLDAVLPAFAPFVVGDEVRFDAACWLLRASA